MMKHLIFDFGNVLVRTDTARTMRPFFDSDNECEAFLQIVGAPEVMRHFDLEDIPFREVVTALQEQYPRWKEQFQLFDEHAADFAYAEVPGMYALLSRLKQEGYHLYGLTNWGSCVHTVMERFPIFSLLDGSVISSEEHLLKPDAAIYQRLLDRYHLSADECLFTDDRPENVTGAIQAGIPAVLFTNAEDLWECVNV